MVSTSHHQGIELRVDDEALVATLVLRPDAPATVLCVDALLQFLTDQQIVVDAEALRPALQQSLVTLSASAAPVELAVARGMASIDGEDGRVEWAEGCDPNATASASAQSAGGKIDYYNQHHYVAAKSGASLGVVRQPTAGTEGVDVHGKKRPPKPGTAFAVKTDNTVTIDEQGQIIAQCNGILRFRNNLLQVLPMFEVPGNVDFSTGNIYFTGSVTVRGDIRDRFIVQASDDLTVQGLIGAATIICGRHLNANCGMAAHDRGCLFVTADATVGYLKNVHGVVHGNLTARRELINCDLAVGQNVCCESAAVIGGSLAVGESAVIGVLGSVKGTATTVVFGSHPCREQIESLLRTGLVPCQPGKEGQSKCDPQIGKVVNQIRECAQQSCEFNSGNSRAAKLTIQKMLHAGVIIKTGRCRVRIDQDLRGPISIHGDAENGLFYKMGDGVSHPLTDLDRSYRKAG